MYLAENFYTQKEYSSRASIYMIGSFSPINWPTLFSDSLKAISLLVFIWRCSRGEKQETSFLVERTRASLMNLVSYASSLFFFWVTGEIQWSSSSESLSTMITLDFLETSDLFLVLKVLNLARGEVMAMGVLGRLMWVWGRKGLGSWSPESSKTVRPDMILVFILLSPNKLTDLLFNPGVETLFIYGFGNCGSSIQSESCSIFSSTSISVAGLIMFWKALRRRTVFCILWCSTTCN